MSNQHTYSVPFTKEQLQNDYDSGMTQSEIGIKWGVSQRVVWRAMRRFSIPARVAAKRTQTGQHNDSWKGDHATYSAFHARVYAARGAPSLCQHCARTEGRFEWANVSGSYEDISDYIRLCCSCHRKFDAARRAKSKVLTSAHVRRKAARNGE